MKKIILFTLVIASSQMSVARDFDYYNDENPTGAPSHRAAPDATNKSVAPAPKELVELNDSELTSLLAPTMAKTMFVCGLSANMTALSAVVETIPAYSFAGYMVAHKFCNNVTPKQDVNLLAVGAGAIGVAGQAAYDSVSNNSSFENAMKSNYQLTECLLKSMDTAQKISLPSCGAHIDQLLNIVNEIDSRQIDEAVLNQMVEDLKSFRDFVIRPAAPLSTYFFK